MIPQRVDGEAAYVLHARSYKETSQIIEVFTHRYGRLGLLARGSRRPKSAVRGLLNAFQPLRIGWAGRGELPALQSAEFAGPAAVLSGERVLAGFYMNELLMKLLQRNDPHPELFLLYAQTMGSFSETAPLEPELRRFEIGLLRELGYGLNLLSDALTHEPLRDEAQYEYRVEVGAVLAQSAGSTRERRLFWGRELRAIARQDFAAPQTLAAARRLLRLVLNHYLGERGLETRRIAAAMRRQVPA
ncbi:MAG: DNA repair protein RecO [Gammaproteobacteria bacterium]|jgi:DNA repair protein RecO (recombination protein O)|nr:DNA repair protein RecO [Gammaproteobacteria bacterium]